LRYIQESRWIACRSVTPRPRAEHLPEVGHRRPQGHAQRGHAAGRDGRGGTRPLRGRPTRGRLRSPIGLGRVVMTARRKAGDLGPEDAVLVISVAAEMSGLHAQTLRTYDRLGIVAPERTRGGGRRYSLKDVALLREVQRLSQDEGVNLAGVKRIIELTTQADALRSRVAELAEEVAELRRRTGAPGRAGNELVHVPRSNAVVVRRPRQQRDDD